MTSGQLDQTAAKHSGVEKVGWVHIVDRRLLVGRNQGRTLFYLPGGAREDGESDLQTLAREVAEELGATIRLESASHVGTYVVFRDGRDDLITFIAYTAEHEGDLAPHSEVEELAWVTSADGDRVTEAERELMATLVARGLID
ncbi:NUDIX hydrolase [Microlunatus parietis]|uniref:8-oxo-dGTP pyrophosphatase MutT (NUDIX family) n=1 Tax=Microlunatus parietis TaxID=682979 RepID=A0A7Y9IEA4_9ACTN|nr:NUDIX domain-containing protein [Microlunatus parietis]NYE75200.1 8-oxo-dGTP pyrophosphatase MutT (NUDIX family) [Microlunatus parietis]